MSEAYTPTVWKDHRVERPRTYTMRHNDDGTITLIPAFGAVVQEGTPMDAQHLNHMEEGIRAAAEAAGVTSVNGKNGVVIVDALYQADGKPVLAAKRMQNSVEVTTTDIAGKESRVQFKDGTMYTSGGGRVYSTDHKPRADDVGAIPTVPGAAEGAVPTFDQNGKLASSGIAMSGFHRCKFSLSGTTLTITTVK